MPRELRKLSPTPGASGASVLESLIRSPAPSRLQRDGQSRKHSRSQRSHSPSALVALVDFANGFRATEQPVLDRLLEMRRRDSWIGRQPMPPTFETNGDVEAAESVLACVAEHRGRFPIVYRTQFSPSDPALTDSAPPRFAEGKSNFFADRHLDGQGLVDVNRASAPRLA